MPDFNLDDYEVKPDDFNLDDYEVKSDDNTFDSQLSRIASKHGVDKGELRNYAQNMGFYPQDEANINLNEGNYGQHIIDAAQSTLGTAGEGLAFGLPAYIQKKLADDKTAEAMDEVRHLVDQRKTWRDSFNEIVLGGSALNGATGAIGKAAKVGDKISKAGKAAIAATNIAGAGLQGLSESDEGDDLSSLKVGAGIGAGFEAIPVVGHYAGKALPYIGKVAKAVGNLGDDAEKAILANPNALEHSKKALPIEDLVQQTVSTVGRSTEKIKELDRLASEQIRRIDERAIMGIQQGKLKEHPILKYKEWFTDLLPYSIATDEGLVTEAFDKATGVKFIPSNQQSQKAALKALRDVADDAKHIETFSDVKKLLGKIDNNINWDSPKDKLKNTVLKRYRHEVDTILKEGNEEYRKAMAELSQEIDDNVAISQKFNIRNRADNFVAGDKSARNMELYRNNSLKPANDAFSSRIERMSPELNEEIKASSLAQHLSSDTARGSRSAVIGAVAGGAWGANIPGGFMGAALGWINDKYGRKMAAEIIQAGAHGPKYQKILESAALRGGNALAATHYILMKSDPEYKKAVEED